MRQCNWWLNNPLMPVRQFCEQRGIKTMTETNFKCLHVFNYFEGWPLLERFGFDALKEIISAYLVFGMKTMTNTVPSFTLIQLRQPTTNRLSEPLVYSSLIFTGFMWYVYVTLLLMHHCVIYYVWSNTQLVCSHPHFNWSNISYSQNISPLLLLTNRIIIIINFCP